MANIFQKIFLSKAKLAQIDKEQGIFQLINAGVIRHKSYTIKPGGTVRHFSVTVNGYDITTTRIFDPLRPQDDQIVYYYDSYFAGKPLYVTNSAVDEFAKRAYNKMYDAWQRNKQNVK